MHLRKILLASLGLSIIIAGVVFGPLGIQELRSQKESRVKDRPSLQSLIESGEIRHLESTNSIASLLPYDSISLETTPCLGTCPVFLLSFYRDGRATLVSDHLLPNERKRFTGRIWAQDYARLTQLVSLARASDSESDYAGSWTDDSSTIVRATKNGTTWKVSDYGSVSPPEIWALGIILREYKEHVEWVPESGG